jgi:uncharacterized membrane protein YkvA (DUF1232 family)
MDQPGELVLMLQSMVDTFAADVTAVQSALALAATPEPARRVLAAALVYMLERFDLVPDHLDGIGVVDDAAVLRLAARHAVSYGADDPDLRRLASQAASLRDVFGDMSAPLDEYVSRLSGRESRGKTPAEIVSDGEARMALWRELSSRLAVYEVQPLLAEGTSPASVLDALRKMMAPRLRRAGLLAR